MAEKTRVVFVSGHAFGLHAFKGICASPTFLEERIEVPLMIGLDASLARVTVGYRSMMDLALEQGIPCLSTTDGRLTSIADAIRKCQPHYILVIGWSRLVSEEVLAIPGEFYHQSAGDNLCQHGCIGMHPTRLPSGRGQAPIPWTIIKGLKATALSVFLLEAEADTGAIVSQYDLDVHPRETAASLFYRMEHQHFVAGRNLAEHLANRMVRYETQDSTAATRWPKRRPEDGEILHSMTYAEIETLVRGLLGPYPRSFVKVDDMRLPVKGVAAAIAPVAQCERSTFIDGNRVHFQCADGIVELVLESSRNG